MARSIWSGSISFGLVNVPVGLYSATEDHTIHFSQFEKDTSDRIRYRRVNERTGEEVDYDDIVKGYDVGGGDYVIVSPEELEQAEPGRSRNIEITDFVELADVDPLYFRNSYYLAPQGEAAARPYGLLLEAMAEKGRAGIGTLVMRGKQYLVAIRPLDRVLVLHTMYFGDEIRDPAKELGDLPSGQKVPDREMRLAASLIDSMTTDWDPERYGDDYRDRVMAIIDARRKGDGVVSEGDAEPDAPVLDLMQALQRSLDQASGKEPAGPGRSKSSGPSGSKSSGSSGSKSSGSSGSKSSGSSRSKSSRASGPSGPYKASGGSKPSKSAPAADGERPSREELYEQAQKLDIDGRSKMSRDELEEAVASHRRRAS